ncbi:hypothetical protein [Longimicrobium sp.]|uniref:hypothetical protein n=1 Tax=Longimicrobium sp. TaxID=2029185 RepID=UPI002B5B1D1E|nr:hypothetical protein [Longimicrobium sp.]HSU13654.1 hypothetical protein [Longimicrobium sp.]
MGVKPRAVELHVGSLVLEGFRPGDRHRIGAALERELGRLMAEHGVPAGLAAGGDVPALRAPAAALPADASPSVLGARLARSVYGALGGGEGR